MAAGHITDVGDLNESPLWGSDHPEAAIPLSAKNGGFPSLLRYRNIAG